MLNDTGLNTIVGVIGIIVTIVAMMAARAIYKKYVGRDDNSITIKDSEIKDSFNGKK